jgi:hypothetical protein
MFIGIDFSSSVRYQLIGARQLEALQTPDFLEPTRRRIKAIALFVVVADECRTHLAPDAAAE